jgi:hypothetical protein
MSTNEDRIESLENQVRRQRRWNITLGAAIVAGGLMAATSVRTVPDVIQAKKFEVVNDEGMRVVTLRASKGAGVIMNHDKMGRRTFVVSNIEGKDGMSQGQARTLNGDGKSLVRISASESGEGVLTTHGNEGRQIVRLGALNGSGVVGISDRDGHALALISQGTEGGGAFTTFDNLGREVSWMAPAVEPRLQN